MEPATYRIKRLLVILSSYSFNLYYIKGKDMVLSDFLSRQQGDRSDPHQIITISFNMKEILKRNYQDAVKNTFMVQTRLQTKSKGVTTRDMVRHSNKKGTRKETKPVVIDNTPIVIDLDTKLDLDSHTQNAVVTQQYNPTRPEVRKVSSYSHPTTRLPAKTSDIVNNDTTSKMDIGTDPNLDFEENSPHQEGIIMETYESPDKSYIQEPQNLADIVNTSNLIQKYLPKQVDIDKILDVIKRKVLKGTHLPLTIKEIQAGYLTRPIFKDFYRYLAQINFQTGKVPNVRLKPYLRYVSYCIPYYLK